MKNKKDNETTTGDSSPVEAGVEQPKTQLQGFENLADCFVTNPSDSSINLKRPIITIPVIKPKPEQWWRVNPDPKMTITGELYESKEFQGIYLVKPVVLPYVTGLTKTICLYAGVLRGNFPFFFPSHVPDQIRPNSWHLSAIQAILLGKKSWVRIQPNQNIGGYDVFEAQGKIPEPEWPNLSIYELLDIAFKGKVIDNENHPIIQNLLGK